jgi:hypothetical protein
MFKQGEGEGIPSPFSLLIQIVGMKIFILEK